VQPGARAMMCRHSPGYSRGYSRRALKAVEERPNASAARCDPMRCNAMPQAAAVLGGSEGTTNA
jgi:hypothetical protein